MRKTNRSLALNLRLRPTRRAVDSQKSMKTVRICRNLARAARLRGSVKHVKTRGEPPPGESNTPCRHPARVVYAHSCSFLAVMPRVPDLVQDVAVIPVMWPRQDVTQLDRGSTRFDITSSPGRGTSRQGVTVGVICRGTSEMFGEFPSRFTRCGTICLQWRKSSQARFSRRWVMSLTDRSNVVVM